MPQDKTTIGISDLLHQFIEALVEEVVLEGKPFDDQKKKWLRENCEAEGVDYVSLESNLSLLFCVAEELKMFKSKALANMWMYIAQNCYLSKKESNDIVKKASKKNVSGFEDLKTKCLRSSKEKEIATQNAIKAKNDCEMAERQLMNKKKTLESTRKNADFEAQAQAENVLTALSAKTDQLRKKDADLSMELEKAEQQMRLDKLEYEKLLGLEAREKKKTKKDVWIICISVVACFMLLLFYFTR